ncbi:hypothetical protein SKAU_G00404490 [Synaphobranchus kaupii]|uniref:Uncharacterized protein n=1 Tax=Synaphobranchus kaupii TaxID=118154 RepID=A0A9Q1E9N8_SYNKA|nr:hypothetical protein SKAU_G00404490 [Synaphobranchus kaupii]
MNCDLFATDGLPTERSTLTRGHSGHTPASPALAMCFHFAVRQEASESSQSEASYTPSTGSARSKLLRLTAFTASHSRMVAAVAGQGEPGLAHSHKGDASHYTARVQANQSPDKTEQKIRSELRQDPIRT